MESTLPAVILCTPPKECAGGREVIDGNRDDGPRGCRDT
jgi:hypothetical protein